METTIAERGAPRIAASFLFTPTRFELSERKNDDGFRKFG